MPFYAVLIIQQHGCRMDAMVSNIDRRPDQHHLALEEVHQVVGYGPKEDEGEDRGLTKHFSSQQSQPATHDCEMGHIPC